MNNGRPFLLGVVEEFAAEAQSFPVFGGQLIFRAFFPDAFLFQLAYDIVK